jgi:hypothetical protein
MVAHMDDFSHGTAMVLQGESRKAACYVPPSHSLGVLREKMVSNFLRNETPERFRVETGYIRNHGSGRTSRQCDLLVHEAGIEAPLYRWGDFVVVHDTAARAVVEIKSRMLKVDFRHLLDVHASIVNIEAARSGQTFVPTFGYGLSGPTFDTFLGYLQEAVAANRLKAGNKGKHLNWPVCVAVQNRNYLGARPLVGAAGKPYAFCAVDFSKATDKRSRLVDGVETGYFLQIYAKVLRHQRDGLKDADLYNWFNRLPVAPNGKAWITPDGVIRRGLKTD